MNTEKDQQNSFDAFFDGVEEVDNTTQLKNECENLLRSTAFDDEEKARIERELWYYEEEELNKLRANLYINQIDRIENGLSYSQTDIKNKLKQI